MNIFLHFVFRDQKNSHYLMWYLLLCPLFIILPTTIFHSVLCALDKECYSARLSKEKRQKFIKMWIFLLNWKYHFTLYFGVYSLLCIWSWKPFGSIKEIWFRQNDGEKNNNIKQRITSYYRRDAGINWATDVNCEEFFN